MAPILTLVGVPAGLALTGGNVDTIMTMTLACWLALATLFLRRWPLAVLLASVLTMIGWRSAGLIDSGWVWPATAALAALALAGRLRTAAIVAGTGLLYGFAWDGFVDLDQAAPGRWRTSAARRCGSRPCWPPLRRTATPGSGRTRWPAA